MNIESIPLTSDYSFLVIPEDPLLRLTKGELELIEKIWSEEEQREKRILFNGKLYSAIYVGPSRTVGRFVPYKFYIASLRAPELRERLAIYPVCITGRTFLNGSVLIGKRSMHVTQYPGCYELVPSGGIDDEAVQQGKINVFLQFQIELKEEACIVPEQIKHISLQSLEFDAGSSTYEVCADIHVNAPQMETPMYKSHEHEELQWIPINELSVFLNQHDADFVPFARKLLLPLSV